jgi:hypothetical protein
MSKQKFLPRTTLRSTKNITNFTALRGSGKLRKVYTNNNEICAVRFPGIGKVTKFYLVVLYIGLFLS